jgi:hypothetical protein
MQKMLVCVLSTTCDVDVSVAKQDFFKEHIEEIASTNKQPWDLMAWTHKCNLPSFEGIFFRGAPCNNLESLWSTLDGTYNATNDRVVNLSYLEAYPPLPLREWVPFSVLEMQEALWVYASHSAPGPDHVTWLFLKWW